MTRLLRLSALALLVRCAGAQQPQTRDDDGPLHCSEHYKSRFRDWITEYGVEFKTETEFQARLETFVKNSDMIELHNAANVGSKYTLGHNEFSHLSWEEFKSTHLGYKPRGKPLSPEADMEMGMDAVVSRRRRMRAAGPPDSVDWAADGAVTPVQNQGMCGSCWAFSAIGAMEGAYFMETGELIKFSEEQLVDCDELDSGCSGGEMGQAFDWIKQNGGVCKEDDYPYEGIWPPFKTCATTCSVVEGTEVKEWKQVDPTDEALMTALANVGPIAIGIEADQMAFQFYQDGVFTAACGSKLDHGVLVVGYGTSEDGTTDFWKVKNSWGETWGKNGYILLERADSEESQGGECGLLIDAVYPVLGKPEPSAESSPSSPARPSLQTENGALDELVVRPPGFEASASAKDCSGGTSEITFDYMKISPSSPKRGEPVSMHATGTLTTPMSSGTYDLSVELGSSTVYEHNGPLCGDSEAELPLGLGTIKLHGLSCPASPGPVAVSFTLTLPTIAPPGDYDISVTGTDDNSSPALCLDVKLKL